MYLLIKYIKSVLWRVAKCLSYIEEARCLKVNTVVNLSQRKVSVMINSWSFSWTRQEHEDSLLWPQDPDTQPDESGPTVTSRGNVYFSYVTFI